MDDKLKKGGSIRGDVEIESHLGKAMTLFCFLQEKDIFEHFYKQHLAKRLLLDKSISDDLEKTILSKLKAECGCQFTRNLENMFRDKELWDTVANDFRDYKTSNNLVGYIINLNVCNNLDPNWTRSWYFCPGFDRWSMAHTNVLIPVYSSRRMCDKF